MSVNYGGRKVIEFLLNNNVYVIIAAVLAAGSFLLLNWGNNENAKASQQEIKASTNKIVKEAVNRATDQTATKLNTATETLIDKTTEAVGEITEYTGEVREQLNAEMQIIERATKNVENITENQEILLQMEYMFAFEDGHTGNLDFYTDIKFELTNNNFYELKLTSDGFTSEFASENNSFQVFQERLDGGQNIEKSFVNGWLYRELAGESNPQSFRINYLLKANKLGFRLNEMNVGDLVEFSILKRTSGNKIIKKPWRIEDNTLLYGFASIVIFDESSWPKGSMSIRVKLKNGRSYLCEIDQINFHGEIPDYGFYANAKIIDIDEPKK